MRGEIELQAKIVRKEVTYKFVACDLKSEDKLSSDIKPQATNLSDNIAGNDLLRKLLTSIYFSEKFLTLLTAKRCFR